jgi:CRP/FNR family transcriptional regulator, cyclic AMP receptor protein
MANSNGRGASEPGRRSVPGRIHLLDIEPDLVRGVTAADRDLLDQVSLPVLDVSDSSFAVPELLDLHGAFGAILLDGMLLHYVQIGAQQALRMLGPGDVLAVPDVRRSVLLASSGYRGTASTQLALLGNDLLGAARRLPQIVIGLQLRMAEQIEQLATQLAICQLPRVEDRLLAMFWFLSESWGRVTASGTTLPLSLTHEQLGALVGARRPTVTLALGELAERGSLVQQDRGWLLLELPASAPTADPTTHELPRLLSLEPSEWAAAAERGWDSHEALAALSATVSDLREQHTLNMERVRQRLEQSATSRRRSREIRKRVRARPGLRRPPPSS